MARMFDNLGQRTPDRLGLGPLPVQSIGRAVALLDRLALADGGWVPLRELAHATGLAKTTSFSLLASLVEVGLVERDPDRGLYRLGLKAIEYGRAVERRIDLVAQTRPHLLRLCHDTLETVNLALPRTFDVLIVESYEGTQNVRVSAYAGTRANYFSTACGRALLAHKSPAERAALLTARPPYPVTPKTICDRQRLEAILDECLQRGWVAECEENELGACCVAAPIFGPAGAVASVSIAGPVHRMTRERIAELGARLVKVMAEIGTTIRPAAPGESKRTRPARRAP
jgi:DNA-binding IclR family transcriptional regulator